MKLLLRRLAFLLVVWILLFLGTGMWTSGHLLQPERRKLQDYHREILDQPAPHGLRIERFTGPQQTPALLAQPTPQQPGSVCKGLIAREMLAQRGVQLPAWGQLRGTVILLHGYRGRKEDFLPVAERLCAVGFRCVLIDLPGHGEHPHKHATFGKREVALVEAVLADVQQRFHCAGQPAYLFGLSQGGAISLQTAAHSPRKWSAVASISSFASLEQPIGRTAETLWPDASWSAPFTRSACSCGVKLRSGFYPEEIRPLRAAAALNMPVFIAHGEQDDFIPVDSARQIFAALPTHRKVLRIIPNASHSTVLATGSHALYADVCEFFLKTSGGAVSSPPHKKTHASSPQVTTAPKAPAANPPYRGAPLARAPFPDSF